MSSGGAWTPSALLIKEAHRSIGSALLRGPEDRFESAAWLALLAGEGPHLLTRQAAPSHVTASGIVLSPDRSSTCLVLHGRTGMWVQPGGHLEPGDESLAAAAVREVLEETGLRAEVAGPAMLSRHRAPCAPERVDWHLDVQHVLRARQAPVTVSAESRDVAWWPIEQLAQLQAEGRLAPGVRETVEQATLLVA